jgi:hypothetical protein
MLLEYTIQQTLTNALTMEQDAVQQVAYALLVHARTMQMRTAIIIWMMTAMV